jgi:hypothetical protein
MNLNNLQFTEEYSGYFGALNQNFIPEIFRNFNLLSQYTESRLKKQLKIFPFHQNGTIISMKLIITAMKFAFRCTDLWTWN